VGNVGRFDRRYSGSVGGCLLLGGFPLDKVDGIIRSVQVPLWTRHHHVISDVHRPQTLPWTRAIEPDILLESDVFLSFDPPVELILLNGSDIKFSIPFVLVVDPQEQE